MRKRIMIAGVCMGIALYGTQSSAQWAVFDASSFAQSLLQVFYQTETAINTAQSVVNEYEQIKHMITQVEQGARNLKNLNLNNANDLFSLYSTLAGKLGEARQLGYRTNTVLGQLDNAYPLIQKAWANPADASKVLKQWNALRSEAIKTTVKVQALQEHGDTLSSKIREVLNKSASASGNLDVQQAGVQMQGLTTSQLQAIELQLSAQGRLQALQAMEQRQMRELEIQAIAEAKGETPRYTETKGVLPRFQ